jgi:hypothetical protein
MLCHRKNLSRVLLLLLLSSMLLQAHALADLQARLELHNKLNALELAALQDWACEHYHSQPARKRDGSALLPTRTQLHEQQGLLRQVQAQLVTAPLLQQQAQRYSGLILPAGNY